jgi:integrase
VLVRVLSHCPWWHECWVKAKALDDFFAWWEGQGRPAFSRAAVHAHRVALEAKGYAPSTVNQRLAAIRKLAREAAAHGWLAPETAISIVQVSGVKQQGTRAGNWLTRAQAEQLINAPDPATFKGRRDRAILALLVGCGLRRGEATNLTMKDIQQRDGRWVLVDLRGKHGRIRTVPVPAWVKQAIDLWTEAVGIVEGRVLRSVNDSRQELGKSLSPQAVFAVVSQYGSRLQLHIKPHDLRRTCAKLCRAGGRGTGADPTAAGACEYPDDGTLSRRQTGSGARPQRPHRDPLAGVNPSGSLQVEE